MLPLIRRLARSSRWILRLVQLAIFIVAGLSAFLLRFDLIIPAHHHSHLIAGLCAWALAKVIAFHLLHMDRGRWRYVSIPDLLRLSLANLAGSALACMGLLAFGPPGFPRSLYLLDLLLCGFLTATARLAVRAAYEVSRLQNASAGKRTLIYGAGDAGVSLLREIRQNPSLRYELVGFIDDNPEKTGSFIHRTRILGTGAALPEIVQERAVETVLIAVPSASGAEMTTILDRCQQAGVSYKTIPGLGEVIESVGLASQIRDVAVEDLLGRNPVHLDDSAIRAKIQGKVVLVTGAAGSIGSELCRQIARFHPRAIVAYEIAETALFHLERDMRAAFPRLEFHPEVGSIQNAQRFAEVVAAHAPSVIFHAAAYKHVPMMEANIFEAIENNVFGTWNVAATAAHYKIADFVMISSDKAVRPTSIMGLTKRIAELLINSLQAAPTESGDSETKFVSVRFGNVLGSSGSVVPIFKKQIADGGPVTVTHPEMRRFFMTIPEAAQLVLQASTMSRGGEIFVLDMGEPVRIVDLARNLILLSGLHPEQDVKIEFTGIRPGEKLYEELSAYNEDTLPTFHEKIKIFTGSGLPRERMLHHLEALRQICLSRETGALLLRLKELCPEYNPSADILRRAIDHRDQTGLEPRAAKAFQAAAS